MGGILQVDTIQNNNATTLITQTNSTTLTFGVTGQNIVIPSGVTFNTASATVTLPSTISATTINATTINSTTSNSSTINVTTVVLAAGAVGTPSLTTSGDTNTGIFFPAADTIGFTEGGSEAMRIDSSGNIFAPFDSTTKRLVVGGNGTITNLGAAVCIKNSIAAGASLNYAIHINDPTTNTAGGQNLIGFSHNNEDYSTGNVRVSIGCTIDGAGQGALVFRTGTDEQMRITFGGALILTGSTAQKASGTTWSNPSDTRLKDNKQNYTKGLNKLLQINVKTWEWNGKAGTTQGDVGIGVIADEIETILPNTIDTYKAKLNEDDIEETDVKRFDATEITWLLLNSVKEQQAIIEELKVTTTSQQTKIDALEARLTALENN